MTRDPRHLRSVQVGEARESLIQLNAPAIERHGDRVVCTHRENEIHELLRIVLRAEGLPGCVGDERIAV